MVLNYKQKTDLIVTSQWAIISRFLGLIRHFIFEVELDHFANNIKIFLGVNDVTFFTTPKPVE